MTNEEKIKLIVQAGILPNDSAFLRAFEETCKLTRAFTVLSTPRLRKIHFITDTCTAITGYTSQEFLNGGYEFLFSITAPASIPGLLANIQQGFQQPREADFDPYGLVLREFQNDFLRPDGSLISVVTLVVVITFTAAAQPDKIISIIFVDEPMLRARCEANLLRLKELHNKTAVHPRFVIEPEPIKKIFVLKDETETLTSREVEVLKLLANGCTSQEIAQHLFIEVNTVETHRKNLLSKFKAKNVAELIKKATKLYWLE